MPVPRFFTGMGAVAKCPDEQHYKSYQRYVSNNESYNPIPNGHRCISSTLLIHEASLINDLLLRIKVEPANLTAKNSKLFYIISIDFK